MSIGKWASCSPSATACAASAIAAATSWSSRPRLPLASAAARLTSPIARRKRRGNGCPEIGKLSTARWVEAPYNASSGTCTSPIESRSVRVGPRGVVGTARLYGSAPRRSVFRSVPLPAVDSGEMDVRPDFFRKVMGHFVTGVSVVTALDGERPQGITVNALSSVSLEPPLVMVALDRRRFIAPTVRRAGRYAVNILAETQQALSDCFAGADVTPG